jgi:hypothetical protein
MADAIGYMLSPHPRLDPILRMAMDEILGNSPFFHLQLMKMTQY